MKNCLIAILLCSFSMLSAQDIYDYELFKTEATTLIESGDYEEALKVYSKVHKLDPNYTDAVSVRIQLMTELDELDDAEDLLKEVYEAGLFEKNPGLYLTYGVLLKDKKNYKESNKVFSEGESKYPRYANLLFNKAIMFYQEEKFGECVKYLKKAINVDPDLSRAHYLLGAMALDNGKLAEGYMAMLGFIANSPEDELVSQAILTMNVKLSQNYLEETDVVFSEKDDDFSELSTILRNELPLNSKYELNCDIDDSYPRYVQAIMEYASTHKIKDGFFEKTYIPWMKKVHDKGFTESFLYYSLVTMEGKIARKVKKRFSDIEHFSNNYIATDFWTDFATREVMHFGEMTEVITYLSEGVPYMSGRLVDGKKEGKFEYVNQYGVKTIEAIYENDLEEGLVKYYDKDGEIYQTSEYKAGKKNGKQINYDAGKVLYDISWKDDKLDGPYDSYYLLGGLNCKDNYEADEIVGEVECYHQNEIVRYTTSFKKGELNGKRAYYYPNGKLSQTDEYADGKLEGTFVDYDRRSQEIERKEFSENELVGDFTSFNSDGSIAIKYRQEGSKEISQSFDRGKVAVEYVINKDKLQKITYFDEGVENYSFQYSNGELKNIRQITNEKPKGVKMNLGKVTFYNLEGKKLSYKEYKKTKLVGTSKYYYMNGVVSSTTELEDNLANGLCEEFAFNGDLTAKFYKKDDEMNGPSESYKNGKLVSRYNYKDGVFHGPCIIFHENGVVSYEGFYVEGEKSDKGYFYDYDGNLSQVNEFRSNLIYHTTFYLPNGEVDYEVNYKNRSGEQTIKSKALKEGSTSNFINGVYEGKALTKADDGMIIYEGSYVNDQRHGLQKYYSPTGELTHQGQVVLGEYHGEAKWFDHGGTLRTISNYFDGKESGEETFYYVEGGLARSNLNYNDEKYGETVFFNHEGDSILMLGYIEGLVDYYVTLDENGKMTKRVKLDNSKQTFESKYANGQVAMSGGFVNNYFDGKLSIYSKSGSVIRESDFSNSHFEGTVKEYYKNGELYKKEDYVNGRRDGVSEMFSSDGKLMLRFRNRYGLKNGDFEIYENGKLVKTKVYKYNDLYEIK